MRQVRVRQVATALDDDERTVWEVQRLIEEMLDLPIPRKAMKHAN